MTTNLTSQEQQIHRRSVFLIKALAILTAVWLLASAFLFHSHSQLLWALLGGVSTFLVGAFLLAALAGNPILRAADRYQVGDHRKARL